MPDLYRMTLVAEGASGRVVVAGELDLIARAALPQLCDEVERLARVDDFAFDLGGITFIDVAGLEVVVALHERVRPRGSPIRLSAASTCVRRLIDLLNLGTHFVVLPHDRP